MPSQNSHPKRALFSLNIDSDAEHIYQRFEDQNKDGLDRVRVHESGPIRGHTDLQILTKPYEGVVQRTVDGVIQGLEATGKKVESIEGNVTVDEHPDSSSTTRSSRLVHLKPATRQHLEDRYDTSDL